MTFIYTAVCQTQNGYIHLLGASSKQYYVVGTNYQEEAGVLPGVAQLGNGGARSCIGGISSVCVHDALLGCLAKGKVCRH